MMKKGAWFWYSVVFTDETRVKLTSDGIVRVFRRKNTRYHEKKARNVSTDRRSIMYFRRNSIRWPQNAGEMSEYAEQHQLSRYSEPLQRKSDLVF